MMKNSGRTLKFNLLDLSVIYFDELIRVRSNWNKFKSAGFLQIFICLHFVNLHLQDTLFTFDFWIDCITKWNFNKVKPQSASNFTIQCKIF